MQVDEVTAGDADGPLEHDRPLGLDDVGPVGKVAGLRVTWKRRQMTSRSSRNGLGSSSGCSLRSQLLLRTARPPATRRMERVADEHGIDRSVGQWDRLGRAGEPRRRRTARAPPRPARRQPLARTVHAAPASGRPCLLQDRGRSSRASTRARVRHARSHSPSTKAAYVYTPRRRARRSWRAHSIPTRRKLNQSFNGKSKQVPEEGSSSTAPKKPACQAGVRRSRRLVVHRG